MSRDILVSIVLAVKNEFDSIQEVLDSCLNQTWKNLEILVVDSQSDDGTQTVLAAEPDSRLRWISESDTGIYDAWNKALALISGDYVCFVGADDIWASDNTLESMVNLIHADTDLVSSRFVIRNPNGSLSAAQGQSWSWNGLKNDMIVCHRGMLHKRKLFTDHGDFNDSYRIAGDYEFLLRCGPDLKVAFLDEVSIVAGGDGISFTRPFESLTERQRAQCDHQVMPKWLASYRKWHDYLLMQWYRLVGKVKRLLNRLLRLT